MLSQLNLRFPKKLIAALKMRAADEQISVNALAERFLDDGLQTTTAGDEYLRLKSDPDGALRDLYRQLILGQTFSTAAPSRDTLRFLLELAHRGYTIGRGQLISPHRLKTLLEICTDLLTWQVDNGHPVDSHYLKGCWGVAGEDWRTETATFVSALPEAMSQSRAECLVRPLVSRSFDLQAVPAEVLSRIFTTPRLQAIFPLCMHAREWDFDTRRRFCEQVRPEVLARQVTFTAGSLKFEINISGQPHGVPASRWYEAPRLFFVVHGSDFIMPFGWSQFSELLRILSVYHHQPSMLMKGWQGQDAVVSPRAAASNQVIIGLDAMRLFMPEPVYAEWIAELVNCCEHGELASAIDTLRCLYGDL